VTHGVSKTPSKKQVQLNPAVTEKHRDTVEGLNRRISCIHRMYSPSGLFAARAAKSQPSLTSFSDHLIAAATKP
jgi:hypothetical protein